MIRENQNVFNICNVLLDIGYISVFLVSYINDTT